MPLFSWNWVVWLKSGGGAGLVKRGKPPIWGEQQCTLSEKPSQAQIKLVPCRLLSAGYTLSRVERIERSL